MRKTSQSLLLSLLLLLSSDLFAYKNIELPDMGESSSNALSMQDEERIGRIIAKQLRESGRLINDIELNEYLASLGFRIVANSDTPYAHFNFFLLNSDVVNAFATPGGVVGIHSGLLLTTRTESELASVLAHEIAHVSQNHIARAIERSNQMRVPMTLALLAAILVGSQADNSDVTQAAIASSSALAAQAQINYTRANEREADSIGMQYLARSGLDPQGMPDFFGRMAQHNRYLGGNIPEFLRTHPVTSSRIAESRDRAGQLPSSPIRDESRYLRHKAKLKVLTASVADDTAGYFRKQMDDASLTQRPDIIYGYALALSKKNQHKEAEQQLQQLVKEHPDVAMFTTGLVGALHKQQKFDQALPLLLQAHKRHPYDLTLTLQLSDNYLRQQEYQSAADLLESYKQDYQQHPALYQQLGIVYGKLGQFTASYEARAEAYYMQGNLEAAITQLKQALKTAPKVFYTVSRLEDKIKRLEKEKEFYQLSR